MGCQRVPKRQSIRFWTSVTATTRTGRGLPCRLGQIAFKEIDRQQIIDAVIIRVPGIARYVHMMYNAALWLVASQTFVCSWRGIQQGDPLGGPLFSVVL